MISLFLGFILAYVFYPLFPSYWKVFIPIFIVLLAGFEFFYGILPTTLTNMMIPGKTVWDMHEQINQQIKDEKLSQDYMFEIDVLFLCKDTLKKIQKRHETLILPIVLVRAYLLL